MWETHQSEIIANTYVDIFSKFSGVNFCHVDDAIKENALSEL